MTGRQKQREVSSCTNYLSC